MINIGGLPGYCLPTNVYSQQLMKHCHIPGILIQFFFNHKVTSPQTCK